MCRTIALIALVLLIAGCTRYGANPVGGPFARRPSTDTTAPAAPIPNNSPLALGTPVQPAYPAVDDTPIVPPRPPEALLASGGDKSPPAVVPANATELDPYQVPTPYVPKTGAVPAGLTTPAKPHTVGPSPEALNIAEIKKWSAFAVERWSRIDTYEAIVTRRELTPTKEMSSDVVFYQYRKEPMSVYVKNIGESGKGRELIYNSKTDKIHVILGEGDSAFMKAGFKAPPVSPDSPLVKEKSRYSIRDAGYGTPINKIASWTAKAETGKIPADALKFHGPVERKEYPYALLVVSLKMRPGDDPMLPNGGTRCWFIDPKEGSPTHGWPVLIIAAEPNGKEVEYYLFEKVKLHVRLTDADFSPERFGKKEPAPARVP